MKDEMINEKDCEQDRCQEYPEVYCQLGSNYPFCDMACPMNQYAKDKYLYPNERKAK